MREERHAIQLDNYIAGAIRGNQWPERAYHEAIVSGLQERLGLRARDFVLFDRLFAADAIDAALR